MATPAVEIKKPEYACCDKKCKHNLKKYKSSNELLEHYKDVHGTILAYSPTNVEKLK